MYPYFDLAHAALCCLAVREDLSVGKQQPFILNGDCLRTFKWTSSQIRICLIHNGTIIVKLFQNLDISHQKTVSESRHFILENCVRIQTFHIRKLCQNLDILHQKTLPESRHFTLENSVRIQTFHIRKLCQNLDISHQKTLSESRHFTSENSVRIQTFHIRNFCQNLDISNQKNTNENLLPNTNKQFQK